MPLFDQLDNGPWPIFQHDPQHTGRATSNGPQTPEILWSIDVSHATPSVVSSDSTIFLGANWSQYMVYDTGAVYAVNPNGTVKWRLNLGSLNSVGNVALANDYGRDLYVSGGNKLIAISDTGEVFCDETLPFQNQKRNSIVCSFFQDRIILKFDNSLEPPIRVCLYDVCGRLIIDKSYYQNVQLLTVDEPAISVLGTGVYFLSVSAKKNIIGLCETYKAIKQIKTLQIVLPKR